MDTVGRNNPNAKEWYCPRQECEPCKGRRILGAEEAEDTIRIADGHQVPKRTIEDKIALPSCTGEGVNYLLECVRCRREGKVRRYYGETSRSGFQRGVEHLKEIEEGVSTHPMVIHYWEEHQGRKQETMMRILSTHLTPLERQTNESINILEGEKKPGECLNNKTEWGGLRSQGS